MPAPSKLKPKVGDIYKDSSTGKIYLVTGTLSSTYMKILIISDGYEPTPKLFGKLFRIWKHVLENPERSDMINLEGSLQDEY